MAQVLIGDFEIALIVYVYGWSSFAISSVVNRLKLVQ